MLDICPVSLAEANAFAAEHHRHHKPVVGQMYKLFREYTECTSYQVRKDNYCCEGCMVPCDSREVTVIRAIQPNSLPEVVRYIEDIGKTVFLSREEAEKAMEVSE